MTSCNITTKRHNKQPSDMRVGCTHKTNEGGSVTILEYTNSVNVKVRHDDEHCHISNVSACSIRRGCIKNPYHPTVYGKGFLGSGENKSRSKGVNTIAYNYWTSMLRRCYCPNYHKKYPTYLDCSVCDEWLNFQVFADWLYSRDDYNCNYALDKDLLFKGNKVYSPKTCTLVPACVNAAIRTNSSIRGVLPIGVSFDSRHGRIQAHCKHLGKRYNLGYFDSKESAFLAYKEKKEQFMTELAYSYKSRIDDRAFKALLGWTVAITD